MGNKTTNLVGAVILIVLLSLLMYGLINTVTVHEDHLEGKLALSISMPDSVKPSPPVIEEWSDDHPLNNLIEFLFEPTKRPPVDFDHAIHMENIGDKGCLGCHEMGSDNYINLKVYQPTQKDNMDSVAQKYHDNCIGCHIEKDKGPKKECGQCHIATKGYANLPFYPKELDLREHNLHVASMKDDCGACHHKYDETAKKLVPVEAEEAASCRDCHKHEDTDDVPSIRKAAHQKCVTCHLVKSEVKENAGPTDCKGCHEKLDTRPLFMDMSDVPRLKAGQNDMPFIMTKNATLKGVLFNHQNHEMNTKKLSGVSP